jgi:hypothetical protein
MRRAVTGLMCYGVAMVMGGALCAETLQSISEFEATIMLPARGGRGALPLRARVQSWELGNLDGVQVIPLQGFYIAHLLSGEINATVDGQTTPRTSGDYWSVKPGGTMKVEALGESAVLETIVVAKQ